MLYLSHYFKRHRQTYYELLQATRDKGAWEDWLQFFLRGVAVVLSMVVACGAIGALGDVVFNQLSDLTRELPAYQRQLRTNLTHLGGVLRGRLDTRRPDVQLGTVRHQGHQAEEEECECEGQGHDHLAALPALPCPRSFTNPSIWSNPRCRSHQRAVTTGTRNSPA